MAGHLSHLSQTSSTVHDTNQTISLYPSTKVKGSQESVSAALWVYFDHEGEFIKHDRSKKIYSLRCLWSVTKYTKCNICHLQYIRKHLCFIQYSLLVNQMSGHNLKTPPFSEAFLLLLSSSRLWSVLPMPLLLIVPHHT